MKIVLLLLVLSTPLISSAQIDSNKNSVTVPVILDHNRMLVEAEIQRMVGKFTLELAQC